MDLSNFCKNSLLFLIKYNEKQNTIVMEVMEVLGYSVFARIK